MPMSPSSEMKTTSWEVRSRVPEMLHFPGRLPDKLIGNDVLSCLDWLSIIRNCASNPDVQTQFLDGRAANGKAYKGCLYSFIMTEMLPAKTLKTFQILHLLNRRRSSSGAPVRRP